MATICLLVEKFSLTATIQPKTPDAISDVEVRRGASYQANRVTWDERFVHSNFWQE